MLALSHELEALGRKSASFKADFGEQKQVYAALDHTERALVGIEDRRDINPGNIGATYAAEGANDLQGKLENYQNSKWSKKSEHFKKHTIRGTMLIGLRPNLYRYQIARRQRRRFHWGYLKACWTVLTPKRTSRIYGISP